MHCWSIIKDRHYDASGRRFGEDHPGWPAHASLLAASDQIQVNNFVAEALDGSATGNATISLKKNGGSAVNADFNNFDVGGLIAILAGRAIPISSKATGKASLAFTGTDFGNVGRNVLRGPRQTNVDFSVIKRFPFGEAKRVEFRAEFFNLFNHVNFANPISNLNAVSSSGGSIDPNTGQIMNPGDLGRITSTSNNPRLIQFAAKINF